MFNFSASSNFIQMKLIKRLVVFLLIVGGSATGLIYYQFFIKGVTADREQMFIFIPRNADADQVIQLLEDGEILNSHLGLKELMDLKNYKGTMILPGKYKIGAAWSYNRLINHLRAGNGRLDAIVQFHNVQTLEQLAGKMTKELLMDSTEVLEWLKNPTNVKKFGFTPPTFLSMFIPNTYFVDVDLTVEDLMNRMAKEYKKFWNEERAAKAKSIGLSQSAVVTLASIVYWETKVDKDKPTVAGVYMNRLRIGMPLQADPTLVYALEKMGRGKVKRVLNVDKSIDSPYNTYKNLGLPPGPILVPPIDYVDAVLNYEKHDYLYFVAKEDLSGESYFSKTYQQHLIYAKRYQKVLDQQKVFR